MPTLTTLFNIVLEVLATAIRAEKETKGIQIGKEEVKLSVFADDTTLMVQSEELKSLLMRVKKEKKAGLKLNVQKSKIVAPGLINLWKIEGEKEEMGRFYSLALQNQCGF